MGRRTQARLDRSIELAQKMPEFSPPPQLSGVAIDMGRRIHTAPMRYHTIGPWDRMHLGGDREQDGSVKVAMWPDGILIEYCRVDGCHGGCFGFLNRQKKKRNGGRCAECV